MTEAYELYNGGRLHQSFQTFEQMIKDSKETSEAVKIILKYAKCLQECELFTEAETQIAAAQLLI